MSIYLPLVFIAASFWLYQIKNRYHFGPISLILSVYLVMAILAVVMHWFELGYAAFEIQILPMLYLSGFLGLGFWGLASFTDRRIRIIEIENLYLYRFFEVFLILSSIGAILFFLPWAIQALKGDPNENRLALSEMQDRISSWGYVNSFFSLAANLFALNLVCAFINLNPKFGERKASKTRAGFLFVGSTSYIIYVLAYVGRDGVVFWGATLCFVYLLLRNFMCESDRRVVRRASLAIISASLIPFAVITIARFSDSDVGIVVSIIDYGGGQLQQFNDHFIGFSQPLWGQTSFPTVYRLFSPDREIIDRADWFWIYTDKNVRPWTFSTYIGTFVQDFGPWVTPFFVAVIALISRGSLRGIRRNGKFSFSQLCIFMLCSQIVFYGVFYFRQALANTYVVAVLVLALAFKHLRLKRGSRTLQRTVE